MSVVCVSWGYVFPLRVRVCMDKEIYLPCVVLYRYVYVCVGVCMYVRQGNEHRKPGPVDSLLNQPPLISAKDSSRLC